MSELKACPFCGGEAKMLFKPFFELFFVKCKDCYARTTHCITETEAVAAWNRRADGWISVKDRLPERAGYACLVCGVNESGQQSVFKAFTGYGDGYWYTMERTKMKDPRNPDNKVSSVWTITHWQPLPEPPKEET